MREIRTSGSMSRDGKRSDLSVETASILDSTALMVKKSPMAYERAGMRAVQ